MKICRNCNETKPLSEFYKHKEMADGHLNKCKSCVKTRVKKHRVDNPQKLAEFERERNKTQERKLQKASYQVRYRANNPERYKANNAINNAVRDGRLERPDSCQECGVECKPEGHHTSYNKDMYLNVQWLCKSCHLVADLLRV